VNALGYALLAAKRLPDAILVFEVNAQTHPSSANAFDSLGEGYLNARDSARALAAYQKSLALNPKNANAERMISEIETASRR
jgi:cytochrome c-type biogenesis protein CcmH/NrfG